MLWGPADPAHRVLGVARWLEALQAENVQQLPSLRLELLGPVRWR